jgi:hypothetical protein
MSIRGWLVGLVGVVVAFVGASVAWGGAPRAGGLGKIGQAGAIVAGQNAGYLGQGRPFTCQSG